MHACVRVCVGNEGEGGSSSSSSTGLSSMVLTICMSTPLIAQPLTASPDSKPCWKRLDTPDADRLYCTYPKLYRYSSGCSNCTCVFERSEFEGLRVG